MLIDNAHVGSPALEHVLGPGDFIIETGGEHIYDFDNATETPNGNGTSVYTVPNTGAGNNADGDLVFNANTGYLIEIEV